MQLCRKSNYAEHSNSKMTFKIIRLIKWCHNAESHFFAMPMSFCSVYTRGHLSISILTPYIATLCIWYHNTKCHFYCYAKCRYLECHDTECLGSISKTFLSSLKTFFGRKVRHNSLKDFPDSILFSKKPFNRIKDL